MELHASDVPAVMQLVPASARRAADAWDEQHLEVAAAARQLAEAPPGGFTEAVSGPAGAFTDAWQQHAAGLARQAERFAESLRAAVAAYLVADDAAGDRQLLLQSWMWQGR